MPIYEIQKPKQGRMLTQSDLSQSSSSFRKWNYQQQQQQRNYSDGNDGNGNDDDCDDYQQNLVVMLRKEQRSHHNKIHSKLNQKQNKVYDFQSSEIYFIPGEKLQIKHCQLVKSLHKGYTQQQGEEIEQQSILQLIKACINCNVKNQLNRVSLSIQNVTLRNIKILNLSHCSLKSLKGLQMFHKLEQLNVSHNKLTEIQQLYKIFKATSSSSTNMGNQKQLLRKLNIQGNDIQHYYDATFMRLIRILPNLEELNGKCYLKARKQLKKKNQKLQKNQKKQYQKAQQMKSMKNVLQKQARLQYQLRKALKRQQIRTNRAILKLQYQQQQDYQSYQNQNNFRQYTSQQDQEYNGSNELLTYPSQNETDRTQKTIPVDSTNSKRKSNNNCNYSNRKTISYNSSSVKKSLINPNPNNNSSLLNLNNNNQHHHNNNVQGNSDDKRKNVNKKLKAMMMAQQYEQQNKQNLQVSYQQSQQQRNTCTNNERTQFQQYCSDQLQVMQQDQVMPLQMRTLPFSKLKIQIPKTTNSTQVVGNVSDSNEKCKGKSLDDGEEQQPFNQSLLHQPTATFAMQKERQNQCKLNNQQFMFKKASSLPSVALANTANKDHHQQNKKITTQSIQQETDQQHYNQDRIKTLSSYERRRRNSKVNINDDNDQNCYENDEENEMMEHSRISRLSEIPGRKSNKLRKQNKFHNKTARNKNISQRQHYNCQDGNSVEEYQQQQNTIFGDDNYDLSEDDCYYTQFQGGQSTLEEISYIDRLSSYGNMARNKMTLGSMSASANQNNRSIHRTATAQQNRLKRTQNNSFLETSLFMGNGNNNNDGDDSDMSATDCLLKTQAQGLKNVQLEIARAFYLQSLQKKTLDSLTMWARAKRNMPRKKHISPSTKRKDRKQVIQID